MIDQLKQLFKKVKTGPDAADHAPQHDLQVAVCALFVEMAKIDGTFSDDELAQVIAILKDKYDLAAEHAQALIAEANVQLEQSVDMWQFARLINENYTPAEKVNIIETLWRIVYVDGKLDRYEDYLMHKLANLLRLTHQQLIDAKLKVLYPDGKK